MLRCGSCFLYFPLQQCEYYDAEDDLYYGGGRCGETYQEEVCSEDFGHNVGYGDTYSEGSCDTLYHYEGSLAVTVEVTGKAEEE